jgi:cytochrome oxidase Cu insertion factor (SCO1/SenC/PrrC family)
MRKIQFLFSLVVLAAVFLSACGGATPTPAVMMDKPTEAMMDKPTATPDAMMKETATPDAMMKETATPDAMMKETTTPDAMMKETATPAAMLDAAAWFGATLANASTGKTFSINDYKGKVVLVETMAVWCTNCKQQQDNIKAFHTQLGMQSDLVTVSLDIDPNENLDTLKAYVNKTGFDWLYAVPSADVSREIAKLYGDQFLNPPSTPMLIIDRKGIAHPLPFGIKTADDLYKAVDMYLKEGM